nr:reverse transcriptase domain-containing protein [Tanacetum cinerariifolium]
MMAIFHDMIEKTMDVFMDDFSVLGNSFGTCLSHLDKMLKWCVDTNLCLNWEKSNFIFKEGMVLSHKISKNGIEVDKAKVDVMAKLPHTTTVKDLSVEEKAALIKVLKSHKQAITWKLSDIKGINPKFYTHKILMEDDFEPAVQHQRRVNLKIHEVIKKEVLKLLDAGLIYLISDSPWVSHVHCVPKKGGFTVVENEENELISTRLVTGWRVCIDYHDFSVFGKSFGTCLSHLDKMLKWERFRNEMKCLKIPSKFTRFSTFRASISWGHSRLHEGTKKTKRLHDSNIKDRVFNVDDRVLLFNSRLKILSGKLKTCWSGPFTITHVFPYGTVELSQIDGPNFKVNGHRLKHYFGEDIPKMVVSDLQTFPKDQ